MDRNRARTYDIRVSPRAWLACAGWDRTFDSPIPLPDGGELRTLRDAGNYIDGLPKHEHDAPAWQAAINALMSVAPHGGDAMLPRIGAVGRCIVTNPNATQEAREEIQDRQMILGESPVIAGTPASRCSSPSNQSCS